MYHFVTGGYHDSDDNESLQIMTVILSYWNMICYMLIIMLSLQISVYFWNKQCLNLESNVNYHVRICIMKFKWKWELEKFVKVNWVNVYVYQALIYD